MQGLVSVSILVRRFRAAAALPLPIAVLVLAGLLAACSTVGVHTRHQHAVEFGPPAQLQVCVLRTPEVSTQRVDELIAAVNREFAAYNLEVVVPWVRSWERPGFSHHSMLDDIVRRELEPPCDRLIAFVDRNAGDFLWGLTMPEVLGSVDDTTHTRGYVVATGASVNQLFTPANKVVVHEFYHLLGCPHAGALTECYDRIAALKQQAHATDAEFFPGIDAHGFLLVTREKANSRMRQALATK